MKVGSKVKIIADLSGMVYGIAKYPYMTKTFTVKSLCGDLIELDTQEVFKDKFIMRYFKRGDLHEI